MYRILNLGKYMYRVSAQGVDERIINVYYYYYYYVQLQTGLGIALAMVG